MYKKRGVIKLGNSYNYFILLQHIHGMLELGVIQVNMSGFFFFFPHINRLGLFYFATIT